MRQDQGPCSLTALSICATTRDVRRQPTTANTLQQIEKRAGLLHFMLSLKCHLLLSGRLQTGRRLQKRQGRADLAVHDERRVGDGVDEARTVQIRSQQIAE